MAESESDSDLSYDRSLELASSHSSDDDEATNAPEQNQINAAIQQVNLQTQNVLAESFQYANSLRSSNSEHTNIGDYTSKHPPFPIGVPTSRTSPLTEMGPYLSSRPYSRSNILTMTAGLAESDSHERIAPSPRTFNIIPNASVNRFSPPMIDHSASGSPGSPLPQRMDSLTLQHLEEQVDDLYGYNISADEQEPANNNDCGEIINEEAGGVQRDETQQADADEAEMEGETDVIESHTEAQQSSIISRAAAVIPPLTGTELTSDSE